MVQRLSPSRLGINDGVSGQGRLERTLNETDGPVCLFLELRCKDIINEVCRQSKNSMSYLKRNSALGKGFDYFSLKLAVKMLFLKSSKAKTHKRCVDIDLSLKFR